MPRELVCFSSRRTPIETPRADRIALRDLPGVRYEEYTTLVIPPLGELRGGAADGAAPGNGDDRDRNGDGQPRRSIPPE